VRVARVVLSVLVLGAVLSPLVILVLVSLSRAWFYPELVPTALDGSAWSALVSDHAHRRAWVLSVALGVATGIAGALIALPIGRRAVRAAQSTRIAIAALAFAAIALPPVALGAGLQRTMLAIGLGGTVRGVFLAHLVPAIGYLVLMFMGVFATWDARLDEASATLGATRAQRWRAVTLPLLRRPISEAIALGFLVSWSQVALTLLVGGGAVRTLPLDVLALLQSGQDQLAAAGALMLALPPLAAFSLARLAAQRTVAVIA
jgi:putative spermidine/putrescine transport system permease protein